VLVAIAFLPLLSSSPNEIISTPDIEKYFHWVHQFAREELLAGRIPLWNPYSYAGTPFLANPHTALFYPATLLYLVMPVIHAHKWLIAIHCGMAGGFMYLFLRRARLGRVSAMVGCLPWMFGGYFMAHAVMGHLTLLFNMAWLPLALFLYDHFLEARRLGWLFATGFVLGVQLLAGEPQVCYYSSLLLAIYGLVWTAAGSGPREGRWNLGSYGRWLGELALIALVCVCTAAIQFAPSAEFALHSDRSASSYDFVTFMSFPFSSFIGLVLPWQVDMAGLTLGSPDTGPYVDLNWEYAVYVGVLTLILAGVSLAVRRRPVLLAAKIALAAAVLLMLGRHTPLYPLLYKGLPGLRFFRMPAQAIVIFTWALAVMSAFGFEHLFQPDAGRWQARPWRLIALAGLAAAGALLVVLVMIVGVTDELWVGPMRSLEAQATGRLSERFYLAPLGALGVAALLLVLMGRLPRRAAAGATLALLAIDLLVARPHFDLRTYLPSAEQELQYLLRLRGTGIAQTQPFRVDLAPAAMNAGVPLGARVENVNAYWGTSLRRFYRYVHWMRRHEPDPSARHQLNDSLYASENSFPLRVLNVRWASRLDPERQAITTVENPHPGPRAWVVDRAEVLTDEQAILERMRDPQFNPATTVILEASPRIMMTPGDSPIGACRVRKHENGDVDVDTQTARDGYLVLSEVFYPGWRATIDGRETPVERADYLITAMPLPAGTHHVTYRYDPSSFKLGAAATGASCVVGVFLLTRAIRNRRTGRAPAILPG